MKQGLSLPAPAIERPPGTILSELGNVTLHGAPPADEYAALARMGVEKPKRMNERIYRALLRGALAVP